VARIIVFKPGVLVRYLFSLSCIIFCLMLSRAGDSASNATDATISPPPLSPPTVTLLAPASAQNATEESTIEALRIPILPEISDDPVAMELEERVTIYKFILESIGFSLTELVIAPDRAYRIELTFTGKLNTTAEKIKEFADKYKYEEKLMGLLEIEIFYRKP